MSLAPSPLRDPRGFTETIVAAATDLLLSAPLRRPLRIGWVSSWGVRCGIAEYSRHLLGAMQAGGAPAEITIFSDTRTPATPPEVLGVRIDPCWTLGLHDGPSALVRAIATTDPDVLVIQHQPGLIVWPALAELVSAASVAARPVVLVLHTTRRILDMAESERGALIGALGPVARIIVHTVEDLNRLKTLGLVENTAKMPQGAIEGAHEPATARGAARAAVIGCYGFFLPDKGIPQLIAAVAALKPMRDIRLRLVNADYGMPDSALEIARCRAAVEAAGLGDSVEFHTEFLEDAESIRLLGDCDLVVLPYQSSKEGSSAALRMALSSGAAVAVTPLSLFAEAGEAVYRFHGIDSAEIAAGIQYLLDRPRALQELREEARLWLAPRRWPQIAARFGGMLRGLHVNAKVR
jgi:glycosyltransferase involved in cell wall biosynthesis